MTEVDANGQVSVGLRDKLLVAGVVICGLAAWGGFYWFSAEQRGMRDCDRAIQKTLRAPATYNRIAGELDAGSDYMFSITYDAENGFGVPVRSTGTCRVYDNGFAIFDEMTQLAP